MLWAFAPLAFAVGYRNGVAPLQNDAFALAVFGLLAIGPAALVWTCAYLVRQGQKLSYEVANLEASAAEMLAPALLAVARGGEVTREVREEIARASAQAGEAHDALLALRGALAEETERLNGAAALSTRSAEGLAQVLGRERGALGALGQSLDSQAQRVTEAIGQQAKMVAEAADLAETQLREAEAALAGRAGDLAQAAGQASEQTRAAADDMTRHIARLETAGTGVADQVRSVERGLIEHRGALSALAQELRGDREAFAVEADAHGVRLGDFIAQARLSATEMGDRAARGGDALKGLMADAAEHFRDLAETARAEREEFGQSTLQSLEAVAQAAAVQRAELEGQTAAAIEALATAAAETRASAAQHAVDARAQVDQLSEAAFAAGQTANKVFEARLAEARALVEQSARMIEEAGAANVAKLEEGAGQARGALSELRTALADIERRAMALPGLAQDGAEQVRGSIAAGMEALRAQARATAEEAQAIDQAFQQRVRRNFEMLSEAVRLMGTVAAAPAPALPLAAAPAPAPEPEVLELGEAARIDPPITAPTKPAAAKPAPVRAAPEALSLHHRLRLTPTATDQEFSAVFEQAGGRVAPPLVAEAQPEEEPEGETWSWKDLLTSLDGADEKGGRLQDLLAAELMRLGVEPDKLLPAARVDEIAAAVQTGDLAGARQVVVRLAPAATRRIARRLLTDPLVKRQAEIYVRRHQTLVEDTVVRDPQGFAMAQMLNTDAGRLFLLLDAAAGDLV